MSHSSATLSSNQSGLITNILSNILNIYNIEILEIIIRKSAHLFAKSLLIIAYSLCIGFCTISPLVDSFEPHKEFTIFVKVVRIFNIIRR